MRLCDYIVDIPDFPKPGILFRDVTGILDSAEGFQTALDQMVDALKGVDFDRIAAPESRGFVFGAALADRFKKPFVPIRKPGKLPRKTVSARYALEYGQATLHMHEDAVKAGEKILVVDDLLATGGTALAGASLIERLGAQVAAFVFPIELEGFGARTDALAGYKVISLVKYPGK